MKKALSFLMLILCIALVNGTAYAATTYTEAVNSYWMIEQNGEINVTGENQINFDIIYYNADDYFSATSWDINLYVDTTELAPVFNSDQPSPPNFIPYGYAVDYSFEDAAGNSFSGASLDLGILNGNVFQIAGLSFDPIWIAPGQNTMATITFDILDPDVLNGSVDADLFFMGNDPNGAKPNQGFYQSNFPLSDDNVIWVSGASVLNPDIGTNAVPVPGAVWLLGSGLLGLTGLRRKNN